MKLLQFKCNKNLTFLTNCSENFTCLFFSEVIIIHIFHLNFFMVCIDLERQRSDKCIQE